MLESDDRNKEIVRRQPDKEKTEVKMAEKYILPEKESRIRRPIGIYTAATLGRLSNRHKS